MEKLVDLTFIIDKSGSMYRLSKDTIGGFNSMIQEQKKIEGDVNVTAILFNHETQTLFKNIELNKVRDLTDRCYIPSGSTALLDTIGNAVSAKLVEYLKIKEEDRPSKVIFVITTDGYENCSKEYSYLSVASIIKDVKEKYGFEFVFSGANIDVESEARKMNIDDTFTYEASDKGMNEYYNHISRDVIRRRGNINGKKY